MSSNFKMKIDIITIGVAEQNLNSLFTNRYIAYMTWQMNGFHSKSAEKLANCWIWGLFYTIPDFNTFKSSLSTGRSDRQGELFILNAFRVRTYIFTGPV